MFGSVQTTPYDLRFQLLRIPVIVTPWFWISGVVGGWQGSMPGHFDWLAIWVGCLFVSILAHEMGHALTAQKFGWPPQVILYHFGGLAMYYPTSGHTTARSVLVSLAGPGAGFLLFGVMKAAEQLVFPSEFFMRFNEASQLRTIVFFHHMEWINLWWGLVNLLPVLPLDGGRISEALLRRYRPYDGTDLALKLSILVSGGAAAFFALNHDGYGTFPALLFGLLCIGNIQALQSPRTW